jgi:hypothetical protein
MISFFSDTFPTQAGIPNKTTHNVGEFNWRNKYTGCLVIDRNALKMSAPSEFLNHSALSAHRIPLRVAGAPGEPKFHILIENQCRRRIKQLFDPAFRSVLG